MLFFLPFFLFFSLFALASPISQSMRPALGKRYYPWNPVTWTIAPKNIKAETTYTLSWKGGSGDGYVSRRYINIAPGMARRLINQEVYFIPQWDGQADYKAVDIATTSLGSVKWTTPSLNAYPEGTTL
jgi:hypothetical protein